MIRLSKGLPKAAQAFPIFFCGFVRIKSQTKNAQRSDPIVQLTDTTDTTDTTRAGTSSSAWWHMRMKPLYFLAIQRSRPGAGYLFYSWLHKK